MECFNFEKCNFNVHTCGRPSKQISEQELQRVSAVLQMYLPYLATFLTPLANIFPKTRLATMTTVWATVLFPARWRKAKILPFLLYFTVRKIYSFIHRTYWVYNKSSMYSCPSLKIILYFPLYYINVIPD